MDLSKERLNPLGDRSDEQLRADWEEANDKPGGRTRIGTDGQIARELTKRTEDTVGQMIQEMSELPSEQTARRSRTATLFVDRKPRGRRGWVHPADQIVGMR